MAVLRVRRSAVIVGHSFELTLMPLGVGKRGVGGACFNGVVLVECVDTLNETLAIRARKNSSDTRTTNAPIIDMFLVRGNLSPRRVNTKSANTIATIAHMMVIMPV